MKTKYYLKEKCGCKDFYDNECVMCLNTKFIRKADITELIIAIFVILAPRIEGKIVLKEWVRQNLKDLIEVVEE